MTMQHLDCFVCQGSRHVHGQPPLARRGARLAALGLALLLLLPLAASAQEDDEFYVVEEALPFDPLPGFEDATRLWGIHEGAGFRIEVPASWNGELVMYAHGYRGTGPELTVTSPSIREYLLSHGFAWAASSYSRNYYDVRAGVVDTNALARYFHATFGPTQRTYIIGHSMGGHVTGAAIEMFPNVSCPPGKFGLVCRLVAEWIGVLTGGQRYDGAVPMCGVMGDVELFDFFASHGLLAKAILGIDAPYPDPDYPARVPGILAAFSLDPANGLNYPLFRSPAGNTFRAALQQLSGGERPAFQAGYDSGFLFWESIFFLYQYGSGNGSVPGVEDRVVVDTEDIFYQLDSDPAASPEEISLNEAIVRVMSDPLANRRPSWFELQPIPEISGRIAIPVVTLHTLGDLFVPFSMEEIYAARVARQHRSDLLVQRAIRDVSHCGFSLEEQEQAFADMVNWVENGVRPEGDDVLDPDAVADPDFGCTFSSYDRTGAPPCP